MSKKKTALIVSIVIVVLIAITGVLAGIHFASRDKIEQGAIVIEVNGDRKNVKLDSLKTATVEGTVVNGKGEEKTISGNGIELKSLIDSTSIESVTVTASDEYSAELSGDEIAEAGKVYLMVEDGKGNLVVFGDNNSKRNVTDVVKIVVK